MASYGNQDHELAQFLRQSGQEMAAEYERIYARAEEDPGNAGDEGEENWAQLLRSWLPAGYHVTTKGRILSVDGDASPQVDIVVLKPSYPPALRDKKLYLAGGVAAVFECKTTLKKAHIFSAAKTAAIIQAIVRPGGGRIGRAATPYQQLHGPLIYGLLAHSHSWASETAAAVIDGHISAADKQFATHPRECMDVVSIANLGTWTMAKMSYLGPMLGIRADIYAMHDPDGEYAAGQCTTTWFAPTDHATRQMSDPLPIGKLMNFLWGRLAWEDPAVRSLADYSAVTGMGGAGAGGFRRWPLDVLGEDVRGRVLGGGLSQDRWSEWRFAF